MFVVLFNIIAGSFTLGFIVAASIRTWPFHRCDRCKVLLKPKEIISNLKE